MAVIFVMLGHLSVSIALRGELWLWSKVLQVVQGTGASHLSTLLLRCAMTVPPSHTCSVVCSITGVPLIYCVAACTFRIFRALRISRVVRDGGGLFGNITGTVAMGDCIVWRGGRNVTILSLPCTVHITSPTLFVHHWHWPLWPNNSRQHLRQQGASPLLKREGHSLVVPLQLERMTAWHHYSHRLRSVEGPRVPRPLCTMVMVFQRRRKAVVMGPAPICMVGGDKAPPNSFRPLPRSELHWSAPRNRASFYPISKYVHGAHAKPGISQALHHPLACLWRLMLVIPCVILFIAVD